MKFIRLFFTINVIFKRRYLNRNLVLSWSFDQISFLWLLNR
jgi:hypothetical protein